MTGVFVKLVNILLGTMLYFDAIVFIPKFPHAEVIHLS